jgi:hypothetical protein
MSAFWSTVIGAAAAIIGGFGAAMWQTSRADKVALKIRRAERREAGLLELNVRLASVVTRLTDVRNSAGNGYASSQWQFAAMALRELRELWEGSSSGVIPDQSIVNAYNALDVAAREHLPEGSLGAQRQRDLSTGDEDVAERFVADLALVVQRAADLQKAVYGRVQGLLRP